MRKRLVSGLLVAAMGMSMLAGCGAAPDGGSGKDPEQTGAAAEKDAATEQDGAAEQDQGEDQDPVEITWLGFYTSDITVAEETYGEHLLEERFNIEITPVTDISQSTMDAFISSGDILDVTCFPCYLNHDYQYLYDQELIREIPEEWLYEYYPTGMATAEKFLGKEFFEEEKHKIDDKCLYVPCVQNFDDSKFIMLYRHDWLENLGLEEPKTLDEFHDMLYAFTFDDPDGNGVDDTYGLGSIWGWGGVWPVYGAFGFNNGSRSGSFYLHDDGSVTYTTVTDEYKQALGVIRDWYQEGIIEPEGVTDDRSALRAKWANGTIGAMGDSISWAWGDTPNMLIPMVEQTYGEGSVAVLNPLTTTYGDGTVYAGSNVPQMTGSRELMFTADATDEQVIAVLQMLEGISSDKQLYLDLMFGEEGTDYTIIDGKIKQNEDLTVERKAEKGLEAYYGCVSFREDVIEMQRSERDLEVSRIGYSWPAGDVTRGDNFVTSSYVNEAYNEHMEEVKACEAEFYSNVLLGVVDLDQEWDSYVEKMNQIGLADIIAEWEEVLK